MSELYDPKNADILQRAQGLRKFRQIDFDQHGISVSEWLPKPCRGHGYEYTDC
jgi:hypothetical protein